MAFRYSAYDEDFENSFKIEGEHLDADDLGYVAEECAEDYHGNHDGWEAGWPLDFFIFDEEGKLLGKFEVNREAQPVFTAYEKKPTTTEPGEK